MLKKLTQSLLLFSKDDALSRRLAFGLGAAALGFGLLTIFLLLSGGSGTERANHLLPLVYLDLILMLLLTAVIAKRLVELGIERKQGRAGSRLHIQIVMLFSVISIIPAIIVAGFSAVFFNSAVEVWFSKPVRVALNEATEVAEAYLKDHKKAIKKDAIALVDQLKNDTPALIYDPKRFSSYLTQMAESRGLTEALVFSYVDKNPIMVARSHITFSLVFDFIPDEDFEGAQNGNIVFMRSDTGDRVRVLIRLEDTTNTFLYIGKNIDKTVLSHVARTKGAVTEYKQLDTERHHLQITFLGFFGLVTFLLMLGAIWLGLTIANMLVRPIGRLINAAEEVSKGNLEVHVCMDTDTDNELSNLAQAFNRMTIQLKNQRKDLMEANTQINHRRHLLEMVLERISAGVIYLDQMQRLSLMNQRASELLSVSWHSSFGEMAHNDADTIDSSTDSSTKESTPLLSDFAAEFTSCLEAASQRPDVLVNQQISITRKGVTSILQVSVVASSDGQGCIIEHIITFDDITALLSAQRKAAWSDVARRIAHEVKNPLTPIQLSAERLKRRYLKEIISDPTTFQMCIDTIIRQVGQIGRLINEFSRFARMPDPVMKAENLCDICRQSVGFQQQAHPEIFFTLQVPDLPVWLRCDAQQISQMLTNLLQNAINALESLYLLEAKTERKITGAQIILTLMAKEHCLILHVDDNGPGFPQEGRERLTEPYFTTRSKGTGLGLAIVSKIVEDHCGKLELGDSPLQNGQNLGARVTITFPME